MKFEPIQKKRLYEEVAEQIKNLIHSDAFEVGKKLPSERKLAENLKVSRTSVRQALTVLEMSGLIERRRGDGTYSSDKFFYQVTHMAKSILSLQNDLIRQPMEARKVIEPALAWLAAERADKKNISEMADAIEGQKKALKTGKLAREEDSRFHIAIARAAGNDILLKAVETVTLLSWESRKKSMEVSDDVLISLNGHIKIFEAIQNKKADLARTEMINHLNEVEGLIILNLRLSGEKQLKRPKTKSVEAE